MTSKRDGQNDSMCKKIKRKNKPTFIVNQYTRTNGPCMWLLVSKQKQTGHDSGQAKQSANCFFFFSFRCFYDQILYEALIN